MIFLDLNFWIIQRYDRFIVLRLKLVSLPLVKVADFKKKLDSTIRYTIICQHTAVYYIS